MCQHLLPAISVRLQSWLMTLAALAVAYLPFSNNALLADEPPVPETHTVWTAGDSGYHTYRIPAALVSPRGTLLAFCEARKAGANDAGKIDLVIKRSADGGRTWSPQQIVWSDNGNTCGNPCPVIDRTTGTIWLLLTHNLGEDRESAIVTGKSKGTRTVWVTRSTDDGATWAAPVEITSAAKRPGWTWYATGPGVGIHLTTGPHKGRLVIPCDHKELKPGGAYSHVLFSDDHGATWQLGGRVPSGNTNECQVVELTDGRLLLNMRNHGNAERTRAISFSTDGGLTWGEVRHDPVLIEPVCQASLIRYAPPGKEADKADWLLFSNPADFKQRTRLTVRLSKDGGGTWPWSGVLHDGPAAYSCLTLLPDGRIGCLYETGGSKAIVVAAFDLAWVVK